MKNSIAYEEALLELETFNLVTQSYRSKDKYDFLDFVNSSSIFEILTQNLIITFLLVLFLSYIVVCILVIFLRPFYILISYLRIQHRKKFYKQKFLRELEPTSFKSGQLFKSITRSHSSTSLRSSLSEYSDRSQNECLNSTRSKSLTSSLSNINTTYLKSSPSRSNSLDNELKFRKESTVHSFQSSRLNYKKKLDNMYIDQLQDQNSRLGSLDSRQDERGSFYSHKSLSLNSGRSRTSIFINQNLRNKVEKELGVMDKNANLYANLCVYLEMKFQASFIPSPDFFLRWHNLNLFVDNELKRIHKETCLNYRY